MEPPETATLRQPRGRGPQDGAQEVREATEGARRVRSKSSTPEGGQEAAPADGGLPTEPVRGSPCTAPQRTAWAEARPGQGQVGSR